jgi:UDP-glucose-4-epimerase GalE
MSDPQCVLVTGGAGYIGSHTVRQLVEVGRQVVVLDSLELGHANAVLDAELVQGDIADEALVRDVCRRHGVTQVVHFAAYKSVGESMSSPAKYWLNNVAGTVHLVEAMLAEGVRQIVFSSSCSVYGTPAVVPVDETAAIHPESIYAETKSMSETVLGWYGVTHGLRSVCLRYFNAAGASADGRIGEDWATSANLVPLVMKAALRQGPPVQIFGIDYPTPDGTGIRDYIHVDDLAHAHVLSLDHLGRGGDTIALNVGTGRGSSVHEVIAATERISGVDVPQVVSPRRAGDPVSSYADARLTHEVLGWEPTRSLDDIIASAWAWHSAHPEGYPSSSR